MSKGPLSVEWGGATLEPPRAGAIGEATVELRNTGTIVWGERVLLAYHWLDLLGNPIVWDGIRTGLPPLGPGERASVGARVRAPIPPGPYRLAFDLVAEGRAWFSELGDAPLTIDVEVGPRSGGPSADLPPGVEPAADWAERVRAAHAEGYGVVAGSIAWEGGAAHRRPHELAPYVPGSGRQPGFAAPLLCPSVLDGVSLERLADVAGLPAYAAPRDEPWLYDGRIVLQVRR
ncbi:MAG TPA: hypothetical protein VLV46_16275 [Gaiellaceae bacterium]|nr:hypothetical protein [Gaiellaceae bacterium]